LGQCNQKHISRRNAVQNSLIAKQKRIHQEVKGVKVTFNVHHFPIPPCHSSSIQPTLARKVIVCITKGLRRSATSNNSDIWAVYSRCIKKIAEESHDAEQAQDVKRSRPHGFIHHFFRLSSCHMSNPDQLAMCWYQIANKNGMDNCRRKAFNYAR